MIKMMKVRCIDCGRLQSQRNYVITANKCRYCGSTNLWRDDVAEQILKVSKHEKWTKRKRHENLQ